jgi:signal transduction histidine kinase
MLEMLQDGDVGELTISQKEIVAKLVSSNSRMMDVANNLIDLSKTGSQESEYHMGEIDLVDIIDSVVFELGSEAFSKHIEIVYVKPEQEIPKVKGDESKIHIVFQNLLDNAIKYSKSGDRVFISITKEEDSIKISIKDTGIGIDSKNMPLITSQFYRAPNAIEKVSGGSGIGLYICKRIIEGHNGKLDIDSALNLGTTVITTLPIFK